MWRREEDSDRGHDGEQGEHDQTDPVDDHGGEFPVVGRLFLLVVAAQFVRDDSQFFQNGRQFPV